jgi:hypothetical protein
MILHAPAHDPCTAHPTKQAAIAQRVYADWGSNHEREGALE